MKVLILNKIDLKKNFNLFFAKIYYLFFSLHYKCYSFKNTNEIKKKKYNLMIDHIESESEIRLYNKLIELFKNENVLMKVNKNVKDDRAFFYPRIKNYYIQKMIFI